MAYDLIVICKTLLTKNSKCDEKLEGYLPIFRKDRANGWGGVGQIHFPHLFASFI